MGRFINEAEARQELELAMYLAESGNFTNRWTGLVREVWNFSSMTFTPALGTILLAKAVDSQVDVGSLKRLTKNIKYPDTFSLRSLAHSVLVPMSQELNFSIRTTGREPINNQPFFRYDHMDEMNRVRNREDLARYKQILYAEVEPLDRPAARQALAAFIHVGMSEKARFDHAAEASGVMTPDEVVEGMELLLNMPRGGPWVVQALGAVVLDRFAPSISTRRLNDPSRDFPGDVQAGSTENEPVVALEARNKYVSESDVLVFAENCAWHGITKALILEITGKRSKVRSYEVASTVWERYGVSLTIIDDLQQLIAFTSVMGFDKADDFFEVFAGSFSHHLAEIEAPEALRLKWADYVEAVQASDI